MTVEKICYQNYIDFVGTQTAEVNTAELKAAAERILSDIQQIPEEAESVKWLRNFLKM